MSNFIFTLDNEDILLDDTLNINDPTEFILLHVFDSENNIVVYSTAIELEELPEVLEVNTENPKHFRVEGFDYKDKKICITNRLVVSSVETLKELCEGSYEELMKLGIAVTEQVNNKLEKLHYKI